MVPVATSSDLPEAMLLLIGYCLMTEHGRGTNADTLLQAMEASNGQCGLKDSSVAWTCPTPVLTSETCHPVLLPAHSRPQMSGMRHGPRLLCLLWLLTLSPSQLLLSINVLDI